MEFKRSKDNPIGFFDSGVGGISVLKQAIKLLPGENFVYFGDSKNAPYGTKSIEEVRKLTLNAVEFLIDMGAKTVVIACNTATSAAIDLLRSTYRDIPVIGIEPALKPAVELKRQGKIIVMATPMTLAESKFNRLVIDYGREAEIEPLPCAGLVELIEKGVVEGTEMHSFLETKLERYLQKEISSIVLGCTHYPFIKEEINRVLGCNVPIIDGGAGTAKQLKSVLEKYNLINYSNSSGKVDIFNSLDRRDIIDLSYKLLKL
jgi:glutamate racemase